MMASIEGQINIDVNQSGKSSKADIQITSSRPHHASKILIGKEPEQALSIIPLLFNICGVGQSRAALSAIQQNLEIEQSYALEAARDLLVLAENAKEHLLRIFLDWPTFFDHKVKNHNLPYVSQLVTEFKTSLFKEGQAFNLNSKLNDEFSSVNTLINTLESYLSKQVFCIPTIEWLAIDSIDGLLQWAYQFDSLAARSLCVIAEQDWSSQGAIQCKPLPSLDSNDLLKRFDAEDADNFIAQPQWQDHCYETNPLTRQFQHPLTQVFYTKYQSGLMTRWMTRLIELAGITQQMREHLKQLNGNNSVEISHKNTVGIAQVEAARGRLIHRVEIDKGIITNYQILAPTEWNFHPQGLITKSLAKLTAKNKKEWGQIAHLMINAIDPCVGYQLSIH